MLNFGRTTQTATDTLTPSATDTATPTASQTPTFTPTFTPTPIPAGPLTIDYTYDALHRLTSATYSDGRSFGYTYDPAGNVLELQQNLGPGTVLTTYAYDAANQLNTTQQGTTSWQYTYDANGSLISDGVKTYTYDSANRLKTVTSDQSSVASLSYNGLGQRLSMDAAGVIAHYVMDGDQLLTAESAGNTTFYLYGLGAIGEKTDAWSYSLPDGTNTPRQLTNHTGSIALTARYTPWGDALDTYGTGNFTFGYFGGVMDAATGLLYVGNGQYYDPATGRFLTRDAKPNNTNPYVPWDPTGAIIGPLGVMALFFTRRKKGSKWGTLFVLLLVIGSVSMTLAACKVDNPTGRRVNVTVTQPQGSPTATVEWQIPTATGTATITPPAPIETLTPTCTPTPVSTSTLIPTNCDLLPRVLAKEACRTYLALRDNPGWWTSGSWNGGRSGPLSPQAFLGLLLRMEFNGMGGTKFNEVDHSIQQETTVRNFYAHCKYWSENTCNSRSAEDIFSFIDRKQLLYLRPDLKLSQDADPKLVEATWQKARIYEEFYSKADLEFGFLNPGVWVDGEGIQQQVPGLNKKVYTVPMDWGNISMLSGKKYNEAYGLINPPNGGLEEAQGLAENQFFIVKGGGDSATIMTMSQRIYWKGS